MASVPPPDVWYTLSLPQEVPDRRYLSALQLEAVIYACQQHELFLPNGKRAGFLIGKCTFYHFNWAKFLRLTIKSRSGIRAGFVIIVAYYCLGHVFLLERIKLVPIHQDLLFEIH